MGGHVGGRTRLVARFEIAVVLGGLLAIAGAEAWKGQVAVESVDKPSDQLGLGGQAWVDPLQACVTRDITCSLLVAIRLVMAPAVVMMTMMVVAVAVVTMMMTMFAITITITIAITAIVRHTKCLPHDCRQSQTAPLLVVVALTSHREGEECLCASHKRLWLVSEHAWLAGWRGWRLQHLKEQEARTGSRSTRHPTTAGCSSERAEPSSASAASASTPLTSHSCHQINIYNKYNKCTYK